MIAVLTKKLSLLRHRNPDQAAIFSIRTPRDLDEVYPDVLERYFKGSSTGQNPDPDQYIRNGRSLLHMACEFGHPGVVAWMIQQGADVNKRTSSKDGKLPALVIAVARRQHVCFETLLKHGAEVNAQAANGETALDRAIMESLVPYVATLLEYGAIINWPYMVPGPSVWHQSLLGAFTQNQHGIVSDLMNFDLHDMPQKVIRSFCRGTILCQMTHRTDGACVKLARELLTRGCKVNVVSPRGDTALVQAVLANCQKCVQLFVAYHADIHLATETFGSALEVAALGCNTTIVQLLLENNPVRPPTATSKSNAMLLITPSRPRALVIAVDNGQVEIVRMLLQHGADPNRVSGQERWPLKSALKKPKNQRRTLPEAIDLVYAPEFPFQASQLASRSVGACGTTCQRNSPGGSTGDGAQPAAFSLGKSTGRHNCSIIELLLQHGADPNCQAMCLSPPIADAVNLGCTKCVRSLLEHGAQLFQGDMNYKDIVELLLAYGAKPSMGHLRVAIRRVDLRQIQAMVKSGLDVNEADCGLRTPLYYTFVHISTHEGKPNILFRLLECVVFFIDTGARLTTECLNLLVQTNRPMNYNLAWSLLVLSLMNLPRPSQGGHTYVYAVELLIQHLCRWSPHRPNDRLCYLLEIICTIGYAPTKEQMVLLCEMLTESEYEAIERLVHVRTPRQLQQLCADAILHVPQPLCCTNETIVMRSRVSSSTICELPLPTALKDFVYIQTRPGRYEATLTPNGVKIRTSLRPRPETFSCYY